MEILQKLKYIFFQYSGIKKINKIKLPFMIFIKNNFHFATLFIEIGVHPVVFLYIIYD